MQRFHTYTSFKCGLVCQAIDVLTVGPGELAERASARPTSDSSRAGLAAEEHAPGCPAAARDQGQDACWEDEMDYAFSRDERDPRMFEIRKTIPGGVEPGRFFPFNVRRSGLADMGNSLRGLWAIALGVE